MGAVAVGPQSSQYLFEQKPLIDGYLSRTARALSACSFVNIFAWKDFFEFDLRVIHDHLCVFARHETGVFLYLPPLGRGLDPETVNECFDIMEKTNLGNGVSRIENVSAPELAYFDERDYRFVPNHQEYCYRKQDLVDLKGGRFKSKRGSYNQFTGHHEYRYGAYEDALWEECLGLYDRWSGERKRKYSDDLVHHMLDENRLVHADVLRHQKELGLIGRVVWVQDELKAYTFGYPLNDEMFCVMFETADLSVPGLPVFIFRQLCRDPALSPFRLINAMDDFGMPQGRKTKLSFRPSFIQQAYGVMRRT